MMNAERPTLTVPDGYLYTRGPPRDNLIVFSLGDRPLREVRGWDSEVVSMEIKPEDPQKG